MATERVCSIEGCERRPKARGWCEMHYSRWRKRGDPLINLRGGGVCSIEGCNTDSHCRGWCERHYSRWRKHGDPEVARPPKGECVALDCTRMARSGVLCEKHYARLRRTGAVELAPSLPLRKGAGRCMTCNHPHVDKVEEALRSGVADAAAARMYQLSTGSIWKHRHHHMDNLELATAVASAAAIRLAAARRRAGMIDT